MGAVSSMVATGVGSLTEPPQADASAKPIANTSGRSFTDFGTRH
jgi:hypothetical protein